MKELREKIREVYELANQNGRPARLGKLFKTDNNYYLYDTGTGKVLRLKLNVYTFLKCLLEENNLTELYNISLSKSDLEDAVNEIKNGIKEENVLQAKKLETLVGKATFDLDNILENNVQCVLLEVTEKCNLRCKYCIYNPSHPNFREFGHKNMEWDIAKKAVDFLKSHSEETKKRYVGFYGGEPLVNYDLVKKVIEYSKKIFNNNVTFSMTTNATLVTEEIAEFLAENSVSLTISLDGPKEIHNSNRIFVNGEGTYDKTKLGTLKIFEAYKKRDIVSNVMFNMVVEGPDYLEKYSTIQKFLNNADWIPEDINLSMSSIEGPNEDCKYCLPESKEERELTKGWMHATSVWEKEYKKDNKENRMSLITDSEMDKAMYIIHNRILVNKPVENYGMNGCCVPGERRIYITVNGEFKHCEKVGDIPSLGNVYNGFDVEKIRKVYVEDFAKEASKYCKECWAVNLCSLCYMQCYDKDGVHMDYRHKACRSERKSCEENLIRYHNILENNPESLQIYNEMKMD